MRDLSRLGSIIKRRKLMFIWMSFVIALSGDLIYKIFYVSLSPTLRFESFVFYIGMLMFMSFPLGTASIIILFILYNLLPINMHIDTENIMAVIICTITSTICFYIQWFWVFPRIKTYLIKLAKERLK